MASLPALLLSGCDHCVPFDDIEVHDPFGTMPEGDRSELQRALDEFSAWTGRDSVCVDRIDIVDPDTSDEWHARYYVLDHRIDLDATGNTHEALTHELCHALDFNEGLVADNTDLFDPTLVAESYPRASRRTRKHEVFAYLCDLGPEPAALLHRLEAECGEEGFELAARRLVQDLVWSEAPRIPWDEPDLELLVGDEVPWRPGVDGLNRLRVYVSSTWFDVIIAVAADDRPRAELRLMLGQIGGTEWRVAPIDLSPEDVNLGLDILPSDTGPVLVQRWTGKTWALDLDAVQAVPGPPLPDAAELSEYSEFSDRLLALVGGDALAWRSSDEALVRISAAGDVELVDDGGQRLVPYDTVVSGQHVAIWSDDGRLVDLDMGTGALERVTTLPAGLAALQHVYLSDGRWLLTVQASDTGLPDSTASTVALYDPDQDRWHAAVDLCPELAISHLQAGLEHPWIRLSGPGGLTWHPLTVATD